MEKIEPGKYVEMTYDLYQVNPDGTEKLVHQVDPEDPEKIVFGVTRGMIVPLEKAIEGLEAGGEFNLVVKSDDAFGPIDQDQVVTLEKDIFVVDGKFDDKMIHTGAYVPMMTADGYRINGLVKDVTADNVIMDFNHPLAGKDVRFSGKVITVRDATPEELQPACSCGSCGGGSCGDGCGCGDQGCSCN
jgi:FKBP-type peptidyl-prolyl cis-trans isomerase SlyD